VRDHHIHILDEQNRVAHLQSRGNRENCLMLHSKSRSFASRAQVSCNDFQRSGQTGEALQLRTCFEKYSARISNGTSAIVTEVFHGFPQTY
jgi:hypothetical protein